MKARLSNSAPMEFIMVGDEQVDHFDWKTVTESELEEVGLIDSYFEIKEDKPEPVEEETEVDDLEMTMSVRGIGKETAEEILEEFGDYDTFVAEATEKRLEDISGIGKKRAESIVDLL